MAAPPLTNDLHDEGSPQTLGRLLPPGAHTPGSPQHSTAGVGCAPISDRLGWRLKQMGMGDLKLAPVVGFILGTMSLTTAMFGLFLAFIAAGIQGTVAKTYMRKVRRIPFGPSMLGASMVAWILASLGTPSQWALGT